MKITRLEAENVKRVKAVSLEPSQTGLTVVGGRNNQGKTSVLDAIAWALGGDKFRPSDAKRDGSAVPPRLHVELSNGLIVERSGESGTLKVIDPSGNKAGQTLLDGFVEKLALNLPKFMEASDRDKANALLKIIGVGDKLFELETEEKKLYDRRTEIGRIAERKAKSAEDMPSYPEAPSDPVSASELIEQQQDILAKNGENQRMRLRAADLRDELISARKMLVALENDVENQKKKIAQIESDFTIAGKTVEQLDDEKTDEIEEAISNIDAINEMVRTNQAKALAQADADELQSQYDILTERVEAIRSERMSLLHGAKLPLPDLSVDDGALTYNGQKWDNMSGSDQLRVATAIVRELNPECGFVLVDKLEQMDTQTMSEFGAWLESEGLQVIATRVSTGDECSIIIEDGYVREEAPKPAEKRF